MGTVEADVDLYILLEHLMRRPVHTIPGGHNQANQSRDRRFVGIGNYFIHKKKLFKKNWFFVNNFQNSTYR